MGHYKLLFQTIDNSFKDEERQKYMGIQEEIAGCYDAAMLNYAILHNYSYERWRKNVNMMIYKEEENVKSINYESFTYMKRI